METTRRIARHRFQLKMKAFGGAAAEPTIAEL
jgi:hypothetical protein